MKKFKEYERQRVMKKNAMGEFVTHFQLLVMRA